MFFNLHFQDAPNTVLYVTMKQTVLSALKDFTLLMDYVIVSTFINNMLLLYI